jgi:predicted O-linked N-acetylglucosamine transferase (SPINDLY family)
MMTGTMIQQMLEEAVAHHQAGRFPDAETLYRKVLVAQPGNSDALHFLGILALRMGFHDQAADLIRQAINIHPVAADYHTSLGLALAGGGKLDEAIAAYREAISLAPRHADALNNIGTALMQKGMVEEALASYRQYAAIHPDSIEAHYNLGIILQGKGDDFQAIIEYRRAIALGADHPDVYINLGIALVSSNEMEAIDCFCKALLMQPDSRETIANLAAYFTTTGKWDLAISTSRQAVAQRPEAAELQLFMFTALKHSGRFDEIIDLCRKRLEEAPKEVKWIKALADAQFLKGHYREALKGYNKATELEPHNPEHFFDLAAVLRQLRQPYGAIEALYDCLARRENYPEAHVNIGNLFFETGQLDRAIFVTRRALELRPAYPEAHYNLGNYLGAAGDLDGAIQNMHKVLEFQPRYPQACNNLANLLTDARRIPEAITYYDRALEQDPSYAQAASNRLYTLNFDPGADTDLLCAELSRWNLAHAAPLGKQIAPHVNLPDPQRRLRIGYVSPDFRQHVVGWNLLPLLGHHNHQQYEIFCYSSVPRLDVVMEKLKADSDVWRNVAVTGDEQLAEIIRKDQIDILVDLSLHSANNRLLLFARKPAPLQVTYLGYCGSTGMTAMDYRFSDPFLDPPGIEPLYAEKTLRLPHTYWCYGPGGEAPDPGPLPAAKNGTITFGCLNNFAKVSQPALRLWSRILVSLPGSKLILYAMPGTHRQLMLDQFLELGVSGNRIEFVPRQAYEDFVRNYHGIDIALDPFPYGGGISTCDALWMGVPVITLNGNTAVGRAGTSILSNVGLTELIASTTDEYERIATRLADDLPRLAGLRQTLRGKMKSSPLMDASAFAKDVESAYRRIWQQWCQEQDAAPGKSNEVRAASQSKVRA